MTFSPSEYTGKHTRLVWLRAQHQLVQLGPPSCLAPDLLNLSVLCYPGTDAYLQYDHSWHMNYSKFFFTYWFLLKLCFILIYFAKCFQPVLLIFWNSFYLYASLGSSNMHFMSGSLCSDSCILSLSQVLRSRGEFNLFSCQEDSPWHWSSSYKQSYNAYALDASYLKVQDTTIYIHLLYSGFWTFSAGWYVWPDYQKCNILKVSLRNPSFRNHSPAFPGKETWFNLVLPTH